NANYRGADVDWYVKADDILLKNKGTHAGNPQNNASQQPPKK
ncbi:MAG: conjugal transfer protein, partial [Eubacterium sp.]